MTDDADRHHCAQCGMSFRLERPDSTVNRVRCPECRLAFWHTTNARTPGRVVVGVDPRELVA